MPVMDGLTAIRHLRERQADRRPVCVAITASGLSRERSFYIDAGFDDFIVKPFRFETVCDCMERRLGIVFDRSSGNETEPPPALTPVTAPPAQLLPDALRERLSEAARLNALTDIESAIADIRELGSDAAGLADTLAELLARYETDAIVSLLDNGSSV